jgi:serine/threonine protein kinase
MMPTTCPPEHELLSLIAGDTGVSDVSGHVESCSNCQQRLKRLTSEVRALRQDRECLVAAGEPTLPWPDPGPTSIASGLLDIGGPRTTADWTPPDPAVSTVADTDAPAGGSPGPPPAIDKYLVVGELDRGGQAVVYRVVHSGIGRDLALKYARKPLKDGEAARCLIADEAKALRALPDHPGLVRVHDIGVHHGHVYLVMDFVRGRTLEQYAKDVRPGPRRSAALVAEAARAVGAAHRCGVVHQDIKPENILVDDADLARLIDFGMARLRAVWSGSDAGPSGGTPEFMPPEQARGESDRVGARSDVFALGAVLYFLLTGGPPFTGPNRRAALSRARECEFDRVALRRAGVPRRLTRVILRAMAADPDDRHASAEALADDLDASFLSPRLVAAQAAALGLAAMFAVAWAFRPLPAPLDPAPTAAPAPLRIESFRVELHRPDTKTNLGAVGADTSEGQSDDDVRVKARLSAPAYAYLIALNPDGTVQLCHPASPSAPPPRSGEVDYPPRPDYGFPLTDGVGVQAFVLVASREPLPAFDRWRQGLAALPWGRAESDLVWRYDGRSFETNLQRGVPRQLNDQPRPLVEACESLRAGPGVDAIGALAFPVRPGPVPAGPPAAGPGVAVPPCTRSPDPT